MKWDEELTYQLMGFVIQAVTFGILTGVFWGALFRVKTRKGE